MGIIGKDFKYKVIKNFLSNDEIILLQNYCIIRHKNNKKHFDETSDNFASTFYADSLTESFLALKHSLVEKESGKQLFPTYSCWRAYTYGDELIPHEDRPSCEISVTINVGSSIKWPIEMDGEKVFLDTGDACIYLGIDVKHSREVLLGDHSLNVFLHYVDKNGLFKDHLFDKRNFLGEYSNVKALLE
jgi:hypothetical protein